MWNGVFPDRRKQDGGIAALVKTVAGQDEIYIAQSNAEANRAVANAMLDAASAERDRVTTLI